MSDRGFLEAARSLFSTTDAVTKTKTVTFGDAAAVRSNTRWSVGALFVLLLLWWIVKLGGEDAILNDRTFPSQVDTWNAFIELIRDGFRDVSLWEHTRTSLWRITQGMFWGIVIGVPIGFAMGLSSRARGFFDTPVELFRPIPPLALLPLFILWFGIGDATARNLLIFASIWIMIIAARAGVRTVNLSKVRAAYSLGATKAQILRKVILPNALPEIFTGIRVALGVSWGTLVAAELVGTSTGLGAMIFAARPFFRIDIIVVGVVIISTIGVLMDFSMRILEARLIPWRGKG
ncbi:MAG: ABC transporter permease [Acidimicrobiia bacterium]|nr:ABC transporter permease [Acidimicrobiia bacterium]NNC44052.1 ABC transporter permease [Acidimicrobiia bacterium]NNL48018.1 ABC transporter permease [Acidimicrobiia bacterium]